MLIKKIAPSQFRTSLIVVALGVSTFVSARGQSYDQNGDAPTTTHENPILQKVHVKGNREGEEKPQEAISGNPASVSGGVVHVRGKRVSSNEKNADLKDPCSNPQTGLPVVIATGEKYKVETDFTAVNEYSFSLQRTYRSMFGSGTLFGPNWMSNLDVPSLQWNKAQCQKFPNGDCVPMSVIFIDVTGAQTTYKLGPYEGGHEFVYLASDGTAIYHDYRQDWQLHRENQTYIYSNDGLIRSVSMPLLENMLVFEHGGENRLKSVTSLSGHKVQFVWDGDRVAQVIDPNGGVWAYSYDSNRMLKKVTSPDKQEWREYHYEDINPKFLTGISFNGVRYSNYSYDVNGRVRESGLVGGEEVDKFVYSGNTTWVTDARGLTTTYKFADTAGGKKIAEILRGGTVTCSAAAATTYYDSNGHIDYTLDWKGNKSDFEYDSEGKLLGVISAVGTDAAYGIRYTWSGDKVKQIEYSGSDAKVYLQEKIEYDLKGRVINESLTDLVSGVMRRTDYSYSFHPSGVMSSVRRDVQLGGGELATTVRTFDTAGNLVSITNPMQHISEWTSHDGFGNARTYTDANNVTFTQTHNHWGGIQTLTDHNGNTTTWTYTPQRKVKSVSYPTGRFEKYEYNDAGRLIEISNAQEGQAMRFDFDVKQNRSEVSSPRHVPGMVGEVPVGVFPATPESKFIATTDFDSLGRKYTVLGNHGQRADLRYDDNGNVKTVTDAAGRTTSYDYDAQNRVVKIIAADGGVLTQAYNKRGNLEVVTDPRGLKTVYTYDSFGAIKSVRSPDTGLTTYDYDTVGRLTKMTAADGRVTTFEWDKLGRRTKRCSGGECHSYIYDSGAYGKGRLTGLDDWAGNTTYEYNAAGQLVTQVNNIYGQLFTTTWSYDGVGRLTNMVYPTGLVLTYDYDSFGRRTAIKSATPLKAKQ
ncbi:MAG: DUF6531 domain-containing protein [Pseudomonadota bacterium]